MFFNTFQWFWTIQNHWFSDSFFIDFHVFSKPLLGTVFRGSQRRTFLKSWILVPFLIFMIFKKGTFGQLFSLEKITFRFPAVLPVASFSRPCFSRNHSNYCAVGTDWFLKRHVFDGDWLIFDFFYFSLCYVLCNMFITCLHKTSVNAQPLSPPTF